MAVEEIKILRLFSIEDWQDWFEDILTIGIANPISRLSEDDIFVDMPTFLIANNIPPRNFEIALCKTTERFFELNNFEEKIYRLLDALIVLKSHRTKQLLLRLFTCNAYSDDEVLFNIRMKTLQALYRLELTRSEVKIIEEYFYLSDFNSYKSYPSFFGYYLRFFRLKKNETAFFSTLSLIISNLDISSNESTISNEIALILSEKIEELYFHNPSIFFSSAYNWLIHLDDQTLNKPIFSIISKEIFEFLNDPEIINQFKLAHSEESKYGKALFLIIICITESRPLQSFHLKSWIEAIDFVIKKNEHKYVKNIVERHHAFLSTTLTFFEPKHEIFIKREDSKIEFLVVNETIFNLLNKANNLTFIPTNVNKVQYKELCSNEMAETLTLVL